MKLRKQYTEPKMNVVSIQLGTILASSKETLPFDPGDGTEEALSKKHHTWEKSAWEK